MIRVETRRYYQTATVPESNFYRSIAAGWLCGFGYLHLNERFRFCLAQATQPFSPGEKALPAQSTLTAKRTDRLSARCLFGNEPLPSSPYLFAALFFGHPTRLLAHEHGRQGGV
jgi:hypothetical protein